MQSIKRMFSWRGNSFPFTPPGGTTLLCALNSCQMPSWFNLANLFTFLRLVLVPFILEAILAGRHEIALALFALAAATDVLDGAAARHLGLATQAGAYFDPIADKCL